MSDVIASNVRPQIAQLGPWDFWAAPGAIGLSDEDEAAIKDGTATQQQQDRALMCLMAARTALICADGVQIRKPS